MMESSTSQSSENQHARATEIEDTTITPTEDLVTKLSWLVIILPGFLSYTCMTLIAPSAAASDFEIIASSFTFVLVNIVLVLPIYFLAMWLRRNSAQIIPSADWKNPANYYFYALLILVSVFTGTAAGVATERDLFFRFAKWAPFLDIPIQDSTRHPIDRILLQTSAW